MLRAFFHVQSAKTNANGAGRYYDDSVPFILQLAGGLHDHGQIGQKRLVCFFITDRGSPCRSIDVSYLCNKQYKRRLFSIPNLMTIVSDRLRLMMKYLKYVTTGSYIVTLSESGLNDSDN